MTIANSRCLCLGLIVAFAAVACGADDTELAQPGWTFVESTGTRSLVFRDIASSEMSDALADASQRGEGAVFDYDFPVVADGYAPGYLIELRVARCGSPGYCTYAQLEQPTTLIRTGFVGDDGVVRFPGIVVGAEGVPTWAFCGNAWFVAKERADEDPSEQRTALFASISAPCDAR